MSRRAAEIVAVSGLACLITLVMAVPVIRARSERIFGAEIVGRHHDPFTVMEHDRQPAAARLYWQPLTDVPGAWLAWAFGPVASYNWLVLLTFPLSAATAYLLARHLSLSHPAAAWAALAFAFSPFHIAHAAYHAQVAQTQWIPLYFLALWRSLETSSLAVIAMLVLATVGVTMSNFYGGLIAAAITPVAVAAYWYFKGRQQAGSGRRLAIAAGSLTLVACAGALYAWRALHDALVNRAILGFARDDLFIYGARWWSYLVPPVTNPWFGAMAAHVWTSQGVRDGLLEQQVSLGWAVMTLAVIAIIAWLRDRRQRTLSAVPVLAIVASAAFLCSLSPAHAGSPLAFTRPSGLLYGILPMFRSYARFAVVVQLMAVLLAGIGAQRLWQIGTNAARLLCLALMSAAAAEYAVWPATVSRDVLPTSAHRWVMQQRAHVLALDCARLTAESESIRWLSGGRIALLDDAIDDCQEPLVSDRLAVEGYTHLLVRHDTPEGRWLTSRVAPEGLQLAAHFGDSDVFAVAAQPPSIYTARLTRFFAREYRDTGTWRWMGAEASWTIVNREAQPIVADLDVELTAFNTARRLKIVVDGSDVQTVAVPERLTTIRIGPLALSSGRHQLVFHAVEPASIADMVIHNGDARALSFAVGSWHWTVEESRQ